MKKRVAVLHLTLPSGEQKKRQVVELTNDNRVLTYYSLNCELPFAEWHFETYEITKNNLFRKKNT